LSETAWGSKSSIELARDARFTSDGHTAREYSRGIQIGMFGINLACEHEQGRVVRDADVEVNRKQREARDH